MVLSKGIINCFIQLADGETVPASRLKAFRGLAGLCDDGLLTAVVHGSRQSYRCTDGRLFADYVADNYGISDLHALKDELESGGDRAKLVQLTGDSKFVHRRTMKGFLVNSYEPVEAELNGRKMRILPPEGSYMFIYDYESFAVQHDVVAVGIENSENFRQIRRQKYLFDAVLPGRQLLFVSRYPQNESHDLVKWLADAGIEYVHFGDLDLSGVHIFLSEFRRYLGTKASFLVPPDYEEKIKNGSTERYDAQLTATKNMSVGDDAQLQRLVDCIHKYHRGYDQEGYIE